MDSLERVILLEKINKLERKKEDIIASHPKTDKSYSDSLRMLRIQHLEEFYKSCDSTKLTDVCADSLMLLALIYHDKSSDEYIEKRKIYEKEMQEQEEDSALSQPIYPKPDYSKSISIYKNLISNFPEYPGIHKTYYSLSNLYIVSDSINLAKCYNNVLFKKFPDLPNSYRIFAESNPKLVLNNLKKLKKEDFNPVQWQQICFRKAELFYETGKDKKAKSLFEEYLANCKSSTCEFQNEAKEYLKCLK